MVSTATEAVLLDADAFARMVTEHGLRTIELGGYQYAGKRGKSGWELYKSYGCKWAYMYSARRVATQGNAAGGAIIVDISIGTGMTMQLVDAYAINSGTNTCQGWKFDEDNAEISRLAFIASGAATRYALPTVGAAATTTANSIQSLGLKFAPGDKLVMNQTEAGLQNDTLTVAVQFLLPITAKSDASDITWSVARSTNAGDVTLAASTISPSHTMQAVLLP